MFLLGPQTTSPGMYIYYGPTVQGHKNPTSSSGTTTAADAPLSSQHNNPCKTYCAHIHIDSRYVHVYLCRYVHIATYNNVLCSIL